MATVRILPQDEWGKLEGLPIATYGVPQGALVLVAESPEGDVVGTWMLSLVPFLEGLWVKEEHRGTSIASRMLVGMKDAVRTIGLDTVFTLTQDDEVTNLAQHAGFQLVPGQVSMLKVDQ